MASSTRSDSPASHLVLIGMMGSGKTTVGRLLAERLGRSYVDSDEEIEQRTGGTVADLWAQQREQAFRDVEHAVLVDVLDREVPVVASLGGGVVTRAAARRLLDGQPGVVWLRAEPETLAARVGDGSGRPLLAGRDVLTTLRRLDAERALLYAEVADLVVDVDDLSPEETVNRIAAELDR